MKSPLAHNAFTSAAANDADTDPAWLKARTGQNDDQPHVRAPSLPMSFGFPVLVGRLSELCGKGNSAVVTVAMTAVRDAQRCGETAAWISAPQTTFFPPDAHALGVDLQALLVVMPKHTQDLTRAGSHVLQSGAFGLVVIDLAKGQDVPLPMLSRLQKLCQKHQAACVFLSDGHKEGQLGSLISLRAHVSRRKQPNGRFVCAVEVNKDKRGGTGLRIDEVFDTPHGLR